MSPAIDDEETGIKLTEASAILIYLCNKYNLNNKWYTQEKDNNDISKIIEKAKINEYLSSHHTTTRQITKIMFYPLMQSLMNKKSTDYYNINVENNFHDKIQNIGSKFATVYLNNNNHNNHFIGNRNEPSIADLLAYCELAQVPMVIENFKYDHELLEKWLNNMKVIGNNNSHDDIHTSVYKLRNLRNQIISKS